MAWLLRPAALLLLMGLPAAAVAQINLVTFAIVNGTNLALSGSGDAKWFAKGAGSYQLADTAGWRPGTQLFLTQRGLQTGKSKQAESFQLGQLRQVVVRSDTFAVVRDVYFAPKNRNSTTAPTPVTIVARRSWRRPQVELLEYAGADGAIPVLRFPDQRSLALPVQEEAFRQALLKVIADHAELAAQLRTVPVAATVSFTRTVLDMYLHGRSAGFDTATIFAPSPSTSAGSEK